MARALKVAAASAAGEYSGIGAVRRVGFSGREAGARRGRVWSAYLGLLPSSPEARSWAAVSAFRASQGRLGLAWGFPSVFASDSQQLSMWPQRRGRPAKRQPGRARRKCSEWQRDSERRGRNQKKRWKCRLNSRPTLEVSCVKNMEGVCLIPTCSKIFMILYNAREESSRRMWKVSWFLYTTIKKKQNPSSSLTSQFIYFLLFSFFFLFILHQGVTISLNLKFPDRNELPSGDISELLLNIRDKYLSWAPSKSVQGHEP